MRQPLPIDALLPELRRVMAIPGACLLLQAPPGAGKTTRVPPAVQPELAGKVWMLEPRRLAARGAAQRMAQENDSPLGQTIGYSVRLERRVSAATRIEVLTQGLFLRRLQADPALEGVDCVIFDEFHERHADGDLALAMVRQVRDLLRPDLRLILMSATLALEPLARQLPEATLLRSDGRQYPVTINHQSPRGQEPLAAQVVRALEQHWLDERQDRETVLVFLPGQAEIRACEQAIAACSWSAPVERVPLHGNLSLAEQARAIGPAEAAAGKVVLATSIAESSLTIAGVRLVIDAGLSRRNRFDPARGLDALVTGPASQASADQRAGRAGRLGPGRCLRLWSPAEHQRRPAQTPPELQDCDPLPVALQLAQWGDPLGASLAWVDPPAQAGLQEARASLTRLGALSKDGDTNLNSHGRQMAALGMHPRLAQLLLQGQAGGQTRLACELAVLLSERDPLDRRLHGCDLLTRLDWLRAQPERHPLRQLQRQWQRQLQELPGSGAPPADGSDTVPEDLGAALLLAAAFPERVALARQGQRGRYLLRNGSGASLHAEDPLGEQAGLAVAALNGAGQDARILMALALPTDQLHRMAEDQGNGRFTARWDNEAGRVRCERSLCLGALVLERQPWPDADPAQVREALLQGLRQRGLGSLPWRPESRQLQQRLTLLHRHRGAPWPNRSELQLQMELETWLAPWLDGAQSLADLQSLDLQEALWGDLGWDRRQELERLLPARLTVPSGRSVPINYSGGEPVLAVKLQELFGCAQTPMLLEGSLPVTVHLLTPAGRPAAITQDLAGFWAGGYREVRRELRGRYPRHPWPEDGSRAIPTALTKEGLRRRQAIGGGTPRAPAG
ncbi:MAG: ATP-dependent helicase HrpB [Cyanobacteriota bacterium]|nr:ATP-dependent helicase HrpB [Cyanobacteriota bacterium]